MGQTLGLLKIFHSLFSQTEQDKPSVDLIQYLSCRTGDPEHCISRDQLRSCFKVVYEINPWFPDQGTLETKIWKKVKKNVYKASKEGTKVPMEFWLTWEIVNSILLFWKSPDEEEVLSHMRNMLENELQCVVCTEYFIEAVTLNCGHSFCSYCISEWMKQKRQCPICRKNIKSKIHSWVLNNCINTMLENLSSEVKERRIALNRERKAERSS